METMEKTHRKIAEGRLPGLLFALCLPSVFAAALPPLVAVLEAWLAAKISPEACGALGIVFPVHALIQTIGFVFGTGSGSLVANALGKKDHETAHALAFGALFCALVLSCVLTVLGLLFLIPLLKLFGGSSSLFPFARQYAVCLLFAAPLMCVCFVLSNLLRAEGKTTRAMLGLAGGNLLSMFCATLFVLHFRFGVLGIGLSVPIGYAFAFLILFFPYCKKGALVSVAPVFDKKMLQAAKAAAMNGLPSLFRQGLTVCAVILLNRTAGDYGSSAIAAISISTRIFLFCYAVPLGIGQGMVPAVGFSFGSGDLKRTKRIYLLCAVAATLLLVLLSLPLTLFTGNILRWLGCENDTIRYGVPLLRSISIVLPLHGWIAVTNLLLQVLKRPVSASILAAARQGIFFLPLIFLLPPLFGFSGLWLTQPIADILTFLLTLFYAVRFFKAGEKKRLV